MRAWMVYHVEPIDYWHGWQTVPDVVAKLAAGDRDELATFTTALVSALQAATRGGYDGEPRDEIGYVSILPNHEYGGGRWLFAFKADNNGATYIVSPYSLGWLDSGEQVIV